MSKISERSGCFVVAIVEGENKFKRPELFGPFATYEAATDFEMGQRRTNERLTIAWVWEVNQTDDY